MKDTALNQLDLFAQFIDVTKQVKKIEKVRGYQRLAEINLLLQDQQLPANDRQRLEQELRFLLPQIIPTLLQMVFDATEGMPGRGRFVEFGE